METFNNAASAAAKTVWGEENTRKEPVSGIQGDVAKGEPYDAGNLEPAQQEQVERSFESRFENAPTSQPSTENILHEASSADKLSGRKSEIGGADTTMDSHSSKQNEPGEASMDQNLQRSEGFDLRPREQPSTTETDQKKTLEPQPMGSNSTEQDDESSKGTGQEYVRSTGLAADGGDFDATKPGAGREADRLMEEKGLHRDEDNPHGDGKDKASLGHRIKAKLHKH